MVFSTDNLYRQENIIDKTPIEKNIIKVSENTSLFIDALHYILEENILLENELAKYNTITYTNKKMLSLNEDNPIQQALRGKFNVDNTKDKLTGMFQKVKTNFTLENIIRFIIDSFIKLIKRIWREFEAICMSLVTKSSQIKRLAPRLANLKDPIPYNEPIFNYTHTTDDTSRTDLQEQLDRVYIDLNNLLNSFDKLKNQRDIEIAINNFRNEQLLDEEKYDEIRGRMLGTNSYISANDYANELFRYFRNGRSEAEYVGSLSPENIKYRLDLWEREPKLIKAYQRDRDKLERAGNKLVSDIKRSKIDKYLEEVPANILQLYSEMINRTSHRVKNTCSIFLLFYSQKLDAARAEFADNTKILFSVARYVVREGL